MSLQTKHIYEFGHFRLDAAEHLLLRDGEAVPLTPKAFDLLLALVERHGHLLEKDELLKKVWPDTFVEEANLASNISQLRKALGDGENGQRYIETAPKRGYRFVADVREVNRSDGKLVEDASPAESGPGLNTVRATASVGRRLSRIKVGKKGVIAAAAMLLVAVTGLVYLVPLIRHRLQSGQPPLRSLSQFTYGAGLQSEPTWSPDGRFIAYSSDQNGNFDVWVKQVGGGDPVQVTKSPDHDWQPDWSPDGTSIVFRSERDGGGLFLVPALGGSERKVTSFDYYPRWSPNSSRILFFGSPNRSGKKVYVVALDGEAPQGFQSDFLGGFLYWDVRSVAWHPDGRRISVWGGHGKLGLGFWTMDLTGGAAVKSEMPADVETTDAGLGTDLALSRDCKKLAYTIRAESTDIWSLPFDAMKGQIKGAGQPITSAGIDIASVFLSHDGRKASFTRRREGKWQLWVKSLTDGHEKLVWRVPETFGF